jgi:hypothetical protein
MHRLKLSDHVNFLGYLLNHKELPPLYAASEKQSLPYYGRVSGCQKLNRGHAVRESSGDIQLHQPARSGQQCCLAGGSCRVERDL